MVELRKRPAAPPPPPPRAKKVKATNKATKPTPAKVVEAEDAPVAAPEPAAPATGSAAAAEPATVTPKAGAPKAGDSISLEGFGGEVETNDGEKTSLAKLVASSKTGVVLFTYPKASTPGCTTQACLFRDSYEPLTATGLSIYGLSADSPKANTTFKTKQNLPYPLLCDPTQSLIGAIGFKKPPKSTTRGVFVVDKSGKVLAAEAGGPAPTVEVVKKVVAAMGGDNEDKGLAKAEKRADEGKGIVGTIADAVDSVKAAISGTAEKS